MGESLHVETVLEGSLRKAGNTLRITAQLIKVADGYHLWSETYNRELVDPQSVLVVQEEIAHAIVRALQVQVRLRSGTATALGRRPTQDPVAYDLYLRGHFFSNTGTEDGLYKAAEQLDAAIARDSTFALAYAELSRVYWLQLSLRYAPREYAEPLARAAALQALACDSTSAEAHSALGRVFDTEWNWDGAEREYARSIALNPNSAYVRANHARFMALRRGRLEDGIRESLRALELDPLSSATAALVARAYQRVGDYDRAIAYARQALDLEPNAINGRQYLAEAYFFKGMHREAIREFETLLAQLGSRGRAMPVLGRLGYAYERSGNHAAALQTLAQMQARQRDLGYALSVALLYTGLGDVDRALQALEQAYSERDFSMPATLWLQYWDPLRRDPRFGRLLRRIGLAL
jgi:tetratricopeptide (TPR) repeat protein